MKTNIKLSLIVFIAFVLFYSCQKDVNNNSKQSRYNVLINYLHNSDQPLKGDFLYIYFENGFKNDSIQVFFNGKLIQSKIISTDFSLGLAKGFEIGKLSLAREVSFRINDGNEVVIRNIKHNSLKINLNKDSILTVDFSNVFIAYE
ncbi:MAG: hypothetical protein QM478_02385 [Flavobacteriaceae bacterium]